MKTQAALIIGGGVGPMAGVALHARIIENTLASGDQDHLDVIHVSRSADVTDRTDFLLGLVPENPAEGMARSVRMALAGLGGRAAVIGVPCNTFHAPAIFDVFRELVTQNDRSGGLELAVVNMLDVGLELLATLVPGVRTVGLLLTTGTRQSGVYDGLLAAAGLEALNVDSGDQALLHAAIYDPAWGLKATGKPSARAVETVRGMANSLVERGAGAVVLGCTELPLALPEPSIGGIPLVDPVLALAREMIRRADPDKLAPLTWPET